MGFFKRLFGTILFTGLFVGLTILSGGGLTAALASGLLRKTAVFFFATLLSGEINQALQQRPDLPPNEYSGYATNAPGENVFGITTKPAVVTHLEPSPQVETLGVVRTQKRLIVVYTVAQHELERLLDVQLSGVWMGLDDIQDEGAGFVRKTTELVNAKGSFEGKVWFAWNLTGDGDTLQEQSHIPDGRRGDGLSWVAVIYDRDDFWVKAIRLDILNVRFRVDRGENNPATLLSQHLQTHLGIPAAKIDAAALAEAEAVCVAKGYEANGKWKSGEEYQVLTWLTDAMDGALVDAAGVYYIHAGGDRDVSAVITQDMCLEYADLSPMPAWDQIGNTVVAEILDRDSDYERVSTGELRYPAAYSADGDKPYVVNMGGLRFVDNKEQAYKIMLQRLVRMNETTTYTLLLSDQFDEVKNIQAWDKIQLNLIGEGLLTTCRVVSIARALNGQTFVECARERSYVWSSVFPRVLPGGSIAIPETTQGNPEILPTYDFVNETVELEVRPELNGLTAFLHVRIGDLSPDIVLAEMVIKGFDLLAGEWFQVVDNIFLVRSGRRLPGTHEFSFPIERPGWYYAWFRGYEETGSYLRGIRDMTYWFTDSLRENFAAAYVLTYQDGYLQINSGFGQALRLWVGYYRLGGFEYNGDLPAITLGNYEAALTHLETIEMAPGSTELKVNIALSGKYVFYGIVLLNDVNVLVAIRHSRPVRVSSALVLGDKIAVSYVSHGGHIEGLLYDPEVSGLTIDRDGRGWSNPPLANTVHTLEWDLGFWGFGGNFVGSGKVWRNARWDCPLVIVGGDLEPGQPIVLEGHRVAAFQVQGFFYLAASRGVQDFVDYEDIFVSGEPWTYELSFRRGGVILGADVYEKGTLSLNQAFETHAVPPVLVPGTEGTAKYHFEVLLTTQAHVSNINELPELQSGDELVLSLILNGQCFHARFWGNRFDPLKPEWAVLPGYTDLQMGVTGVIGGDSTPTDNPTSLSRYSFIIGNPQASAVNNLHFTANVLGEAIPTDLIVGGVLAYLSRMGLRGDANCSFYTDVSPTETSGSSSGPQMLEAWETHEEALIFTAGGISLILPGPNHSDNQSQDAAESYLWRPSAAKQIEIQSFTTAWLALSAADKAATTLSLPII